jgi:hypothetical protein
MIAVALSSYEPQYIRKIRIKLEMQKYILRDIAFHYSFYSVSFPLLHVSPSLTQIYLHSM